MESILKWCAKHKVFTVSVIFFSIVVVPFIPFVRSGIGTVIKEDAIIFLQYYGTILAGILGGFLTLYGVWWTIEVQNNIRNEDQAKRDVERKEELINQYKPILILKAGNVNFTVQDLAMQAKFVLLNKGRGEATDISIELINSNCVVFPINISTNILTANDEVNLTINLAKNQVNPPMVTDAVNNRISSSDSFHFTLMIKYKGSFENSYYITKTEVQIESVYVITSPIKDFNANYPERWVSNISKLELLKE